MKRTQLLKHLKEHGAYLLREGIGIAFTDVQSVRHKFLAMLKSLMSLPEKFVKTLKYHL